MTHRKITTIDGGSAQYWRQRKRGFGLIQDAEHAARQIVGAPLYIAGAWDDDYGDYEPVENLAPFERMDETIRAIEADETAISILIAQGRTSIGGYQIRAVVDALGQHGIGGPERNPLWRPGTD
ncbi:MULTISPECIES: hypothetical protein [Rhizobiaceae]|uniref:hypothetical protein n=1 Tax=Rhizobiaceae TaxID=82115 RepID=UPI0003C552AD|nr:MULTISPECIES: hypothetical protein [Hyphomicrobiales]EYR77633.1 hypothetical protein SHLA_101c000010 [Shinella sp. DD12]MCA0341336.1 hypothetical protein [Pseudomonadota bacterium]VVT00866.1 conserved hypothetical protein [Hoeflea sp. EC-HK425]